MSTTALFVVFTAALLMTLLLYPAWASGRNKKTGPTDPYQFSFRSIDNAPLPLGFYKGKLLLVVNTASRCGFTPQYAGLQKLHEVYGPRGLVVLGVPSNDFGKQEPESCEIIQRFTSENFSVTFPLAYKERVVGKYAHPFYRWIQNQLGFIAAPKWNFYKYLISPEGKPVAWFSSKTAPDDTKLIEAIERHLPAPSRT